MSERSSVWTLVSAVGTGQTPSPSVVGRLHDGPLTTDSVPTSNASSQAELTPWDEQSFRTIRAQSRLQQSTHIVPIRWRPRSTRPTGFPVHPCLPRKNICATGVLLSTPPPSPKFEWPHNNDGCAQFCQCPGRYTAYETLLRPSEKSLSRGLSIRRCPAHWSKSEYRAIDFLKACPSSACKRHEATLQSTGRTQSSAKRIGQLQNYSCVE